MAKIEKTDSIGSISLKISIDTSITLWQAIKLRIAGKNYEPIAQAICDVIKDNAKKMDD